MSVQGEAVGTLPQRHTAGWSRDGLRRQPSTERCGEQAGDRALRTAPRLQREEQTCLRSAQTGVRTGRTHYRPSACQEKRCVGVRVGDSGDSLGSGVLEARA